MKRFSFPLERVRRFRSEQASLEESKLRQFQGYLAALGSERRVLELARARSEQGVLAQPSIEARELQSLEAYRRHLGNKVRDLEKHQRQCEAQVREQRQRLIEARQRAGLLDRLKQNGLEEWTAANNREEEALVTELYLAKRR